MIAKRAGFVPARLASRHCALVADSEPSVVVHAKGGEGWQLLREDDVRARLGVPPRLVFDLLALAGDPSDGLPVATCTRRDPRRCAFKVTSWRPSARSCGPAADNSRHGAAGAWPMVQARKGRRGANFSVPVTDEERVRSGVEPPDTSTMQELIEMGAEVFLPSRFLSLWRVTTHHRRTLFDRPHPCEPPPHARAPPATRPAEGPVTQFEAIRDPSLRLAVVGALARARKLSLRDVPAATQQTRVNSKTLRALLTLAVPDSALASITELRWEGGGHEVQHRGAGICWMRRPRPPANQATRPAPTARMLVRTSPNSARHVAS